MLRWVVMALLLANVAFFALTRGEAVRVDREPNRHAQQVHPEVVRLLPTGSAEAASAPRSASAVVDATTASAAETSAVAASSAPATRCFEAGPFNTDEIAAAEAALTASPAASALAQRWTRTPGEMPGTPASAASSVQHLRVEAATPEEATALESLPAGLLTHKFAPCAPR